MVQPQRIAGLAEICSQYLVTGQQVYVEGRLKSRTDRGSHFNNEVTMSVVDFLGGKSGASEAMRSDADDVGDLPF